MASARPQRRAKGRRRAKKNLNLENIDISFNHESIFFFLNKQCIPSSFSSINSIYQVSLYRNALSIVKMSSGLSIIIQTRVENPTDRIDLISLCINNVEKVCLLKNLLSSTYGGHLALIKKGTSLCDGQCNGLIIKVGK